MSDRDKWLSFLAAAVFLVVVAAPALAHGDAATPGVNGVTAPALHPETRVDPALPAGVALQKPVKLTVEFVVDRTGAVRDVKVEGGSAHSDLVKATVDAISQWKFEPGTWNGKAVDTLPVVEFHFGDPMDAEGTPARAARVAPGTPAFDGSMFAFSVVGDSIRQWLPKGSDPRGPGNQTQQYDGPKLANAPRPNCGQAGAKCVYEKVEPVATRLVQLPAPAGGF